MKTFKAQIVDSSQIYFNTFSAAVQYARLQAEKRGFEVDEDDWFNKVSVSYPGKPKEGDTFKANGIGLVKDGKPQRVALHIQVYNRGGTGNIYELNYYIR